MFAGPGHWNAADLGKPEIEHLHGALRRDLDVAGLEVAVDDASVVRGREGVCDLRRQADGFGERDRAFLDALGEGRTLHQLHDQVVRSDVVQLTDVGMVQRGDGPRLAFETLAETLSGDLEGHIAAKAGIAGAIDFTHAARADGRHDFVRAEFGACPKRHMVAGL